MTGTHVVSAGSTPWWLRHAALLPNIALGVSGTAAAIEVVRIVVHGYGLLAVAGTLVTVAGATVSRRVAWVGLLLSIAGCAVACLPGRDPIVEWTIVVFTLFGVTLRGLPPIRSIGVSVVTVYVIVAFLAQAGAVSVDALAAVAAVIAGGAAGAGLRSQQRYWMELRLRADDAIATQEAAANRRVGQERLRIARDLHDVVGHQVAVASMHLGAVEVTVRHDPEQAARAAERARAALRTVTVETQRILELLRTDDTVGGSDQKVAGLISIPELVESFEQIGLRIDTGGLSPSTSTDPAAEVTAYRLVQEALTNAHKYGDGSATLRIDTRADGIEIEVTNPVPGSLSSGVRSGYGLIGMQERVHATGGYLETGVQDGVFTVRATLSRDGRSVW